VGHSSGGPGSGQPLAPSQEITSRTSAFAGGKGCSPMSGHLNAPSGAAPAMTIGLDVEVRILDFLNRRAEIEAGVWCRRARVFGDFLVGQLGERAVSQAMLTQFWQPVSPTV
jgi:hypothetical protein